MYDIVHHAPVDGAADAKAWWKQSRRAALMLLYDATTLVCAEVPGSVGPGQGETIW